MRDLADQDPAARHGQGARVADACVAGLFMLLGLYIGFVSVTELGAFEQGRIGPGVLPFLIGLTLILTSGLVLLGLWRNAASAPEAEMPSAAEASRAASVLILTIVCVALMPFIGSLAALGLLVLVETLVIEKRGWRLSLATALVIPALLYVFFEWMLGVPLPSGLLGLL